MKFIIYILITLSFTFSYNKNLGFIKNLILPGWGFVDTDKDKSGTFFLREMILWGSLFSSHQVSDIYEKNYIAYGTNYANTNVARYSSIYSINVGNYNSIHSYNAAMLAQRSPENVYATGAGFDWEWDTNQHRVKYKKMLQTSRDLDKIGDFAIAGILIHRIVAGVNYLYYMKKGRSFRLSSDIKAPNRETVELTLKFKLY